MKPDMKLPFKTLFAAAALAVCGCAQQIEVEPLTIDFGSMSGEIGEEGGYLRIPYSFTGSFYDSQGQPAELTVSCDASWITAAYTDAPGEIIFKVEANGGEDPRTAAADIACGKYTGTATITQLGRQGGTVSDAEFTISADRVDEAYVVYSVTPRDNEMTYINLLAQKSVYDSFPDDESRFENDMAYFSKIAQNNGISLEELLGMNIKKGPVRGVEVGSLTPEEDWTIYVYGLTAGGERLTGYTSIEVTTLPVKQIDVSFKFSSQIDGSSVMLMADPSDDTVPYVIDAYLKAGLNKDNIKEMYQEHIKGVIEMLSMFGQSVSDIIKSIAHIGPDAVVADMNADTEYVAFACGISLSGYLNSEVTTYEFRTGAPEPSDNVITIEITSVTSSEAKYKITVTNNDQYAIAASEASAWEGKSDDEILAELLGQDLSSQTTRGECTGSIPGLQPGKKYVLFAFGYSGGIATTGLSKAEFTTPGESGTTAGAPQVRIDRPAALPEARALFLPATQVKNTRM